jgi:flagellar biogenesis protein FliO
MAQDVSVVEVFVRLVAAFALIVGILGGAVFVLRRRGGLRVTAAGSARRLRVVERQSLSRAASLTVVRLGTRAYLIGATDSSVSLLADVSDELGDDGGNGMPRGGTDAEGADLEHQGTGAHAGVRTLQTSRMDLVGAILQRMGRRG